LNKFSSVNTLTVVFDILYYVKKQNIGKKKFKNLAKDIFTENLDEFVGLFDINSFKTFLYFILKYSGKYKNINIKFKDYSKRIEKVDEDIVINCEIKMLIILLSNFYKRKFEKFEKFSFNAPNDIYLIYDKDILIIRFGNYEKYNFNTMEINFDKLFYIKDYENEMSLDHEFYLKTTEEGLISPNLDYTLKCFTDPKNDKSEIKYYYEEGFYFFPEEYDCIEEGFYFFPEEYDCIEEAKYEFKFHLYSHENIHYKIELANGYLVYYPKCKNIVYPIGLFEFNYGFFSNIVNKLILINSVKIEYLFDMAKTLSRENHFKVKYICLDQIKTQNFTCRDFEFFALDETDVYSFDQIYLNYHEMF